MVKEGFARGASTKERRCLKHFRKAAGEAVEKLGQAQGVHPETIIPYYKAQEEEREVVRRA
jgi:hypothetical protein